MHAQDYAHVLSLFTKDETLLFYEKLAHELTVAIRGFWSHPEHSDAQKIEELKWTNEIMHRVTSQIHSIRMGIHSESEVHFFEGVLHWIQHCPSMQEGINEALFRAFNQTLTQTQNIDEQTK